MLNDRILFLTARNQLDRHNFALPARNNVVLLWTQQKRSSLFNKFTSWEKNKSEQTCSLVLTPPLAVNKSNLPPQTEHLFFKEKNAEVFKPSSIRAWNPNHKCFDWKRPLFWEGAKAKNRAQTGSRNHKKTTNECPNVSWGWPHSSLPSDHCTPQINHQSCGERSWLKTRLKFCFVSWLTFVFSFKGCFIPTFSGFIPTIFDL